MHTYAYTHKPPHTITITCADHITCDVHLQAAKSSSAPKSLCTIKFPPSLARTMFVDEFSAAFGVLPKDWAEGAANIMGNTVEQWKASYAPKRKSRLAQLAIASHQLITRARIAEAAQAGMGGDEQDEEEQDVEWEMAGLPVGVPKIT